MKAIGILAIVTVVLAIIVLSIWVRFEAPCSLFSFAPVKDIPGRCLMQGK